MFVEPGIEVKIDKRNSHLIKVNIIDISVSLTLEVLKDACNILYPVFSYRRLSEVIGIRKQSLDEEDMALSMTKNQRKGNLFESQYNFYVDTYASETEE